MDYASEFYDGETFDLSVGGQAFTATIERDEHPGAPWVECGGHGEVSPWTNTHKAPGDKVLSEDRGLRRLYHFADACKTARRDGWTHLPGTLKRTRTTGGLHVAWAETPDGRMFATVAEDINAAIDGVYQGYRATRTPRQIAAEAAQADFEYLRAWCADDWFYAVVTVRRKGACPHCGDSESLGGVESFGADHTHETARELAQELIERGGVSDGTL